MNIKTGTIIAALLLLSACHTRQEWKAGKINVTQYPLRVTVQPLQNQKTNSWIPILTAQLSTNSNIILTKKNWQYSCWMAVEDNRLSLIWYHRDGKIASVALLHEDKFANRQQGAGRTEGTAHILRQLNRLINNTFKLKENK